EAAGTLRPSPCRAHRHAAEVRQRAVAHDGRRVARTAAAGGRSSISSRHVVGGGGRRGRPHGVNMADTNAPVTQESYIVAEGKKRGSTRDVRPEAAHDRYYTVLKVHGGDAILNDNWHTNE